MVSMVGGKMSEFQKAKLKQGKILYILRLWFDKTVLPDLKHCLAPISGKKPKPEAKTKAKKASAIVTEEVGGKPMTKTKPKPVPAQNEQELFIALCGQKPDLLPGELAEEPNYLDKIVSLNLEWLYAILEGKKVVELRKFRLTSGSEAETMYLASGKTILGRCLISAPFSIETEEQFVALKNQHGWVAISTAIHGAWLVKSAEAETVGLCETPGLPR